ncbi:hypothetical protein Sjap_020404 [Stephania japonica]|uniref:Uncharacterized protein n=1 Tax=Stephania japonica TaxID=461633 RepID=A0AAP0F0K3_9MAGN
MKESKASSKIKSNVRGQQREAILATSARSRSQIMSEEGSHETTTSEGNGSNEQATSTIMKEKRMRGRTLMRSINSLIFKLKIEFNDEGQMVGENSKKLASYMGVLACEHASLDFSSWTKVDSLTNNRL